MTSNIRCDVFQTSFSVQKRASVNIWMPTDDSNANSQHLNQPTNLNQRDEFQGSEDWLLVQEDNTFLARDESNKSLGKQDRISWENKRKSSTGKGRQNLDSSVVFGVTSRSTLTTDQTSQLEREVSSSGEMSSKEQQGLMIRIFGVFPVHVGGGVP